MQKNLPYWLEKDFICPVKIQTYKMIENFFKDSFLYLIAICYDTVIGYSVRLFVMLNMPHFPAQDVINAIAIVLGVLRIIPAFMASVKAFRDRKNPENGKS